MKEFFVNNWKSIILFIFVIAELMVVIFKPRTKVNSKLEEILAYLPVFINFAEEYVNKTEKKKFVIDSIKKLLKLDDSYDSFIDESLEYILSTPTKKSERKNDEK